jgi:hypothetical protein
MYDANNSHCESIMLLKPINPRTAKDNLRGSHFGRHTDRATVVRPWLKPVEAEWPFARTAAAGDSAADPVKIIDLASPK